MVPQCFLPFSPLSARPLCKYSAGGWNVLGLLNETRGVYEAAYRCFSNALVLLPEPADPSKSKKQPQPKSFRTVLSLCDTSSNGRSSAKCMTVNAEPPIPNADDLSDSEKAKIVLLNRARLLMRMNKYGDAVQDFKRAGVGGTTIR